jgi:arylsulfatase A-like enzyme
MTGLHPHQNGLVGLTHLGWEIDDGDGVPTLPQVLWDAGYGTFLFGGQHEASDPASLGYDRVRDSRSERTRRSARRGGVRRARRAGD